MARKKYIDSSVITPLGELVEKHMPNLTKFNNEHPDIRKQYVTDEGTYTPFHLLGKIKELKVYLGPKSGRTG